jgi:hypothetical protein
MVRMHEVGFAGTTVSFVNFKNELPYFIVEVLPLLGEVALRGALQEGKGGRSVRSLQGSTTAIKLPVTHSNFKRGRIVSLGSTTTAASHGSSPPATLPESASS